MPSLNWRRNTGLPPNLKDGDGFVVVRDRGGGLPLLVDCVSWCDWAYGREFVTRDGSELLWRWSEVVYWLPEAELLATLPEV